MRGILWLTDSSHEIVKSAGSPVQISIHVLEEELGTRRNITHETGVATRSAGRGSFVVGCVPMAVEINTSVSGRNTEL